jgi:hypothetical protein
MIRGALTQLISYGAQDFHLTNRIFYYINDNNDDNNDDIVNDNYNNNDEIINDNHNYVTILLNLIVSVHSQNDLSQNFKQYLNIIVKGYLE